ncbi:MAG: glycosyltransferase family 2 protein [Planctomycetes bacterium]|nr:glycosyltransferase family 2 protein [Planctomycetota bacterium]
MVELRKQTSSGHESVTDRPLVSVVMPCLDEERTVASCVQKALHVMAEMGVAGEVVVSDNGSTDNSVAEAVEAGARVVHCPERGYGNAVRFGVEASRGDFVIMGDADSSYDFGSIERFIRPLQEGADLVMGNRFLGGIRPGAMPWKNRYLGNPALTKLLNLFFRTGVGDAHCGLRGFSRTAFQRMRLESRGMEFASEMVVKAAKREMQIVEVPTTLDPDGRDRPPHLAPWRDGWRHLKFLLMFSPLHLFLIPGAILVVIGLLLLLLPAGGTYRIADFHFDVHWMVLGVLLLVVGVQILEFGILARLYTVTHRFPERDPTLEWLRRHLKVEYGLLLGTALFGIGMAIDIWVLMEWIDAQFGQLQRVRPALVATALVAVGVQVVFFSFLFAILDSGADQKMSCDVNPNTEETKRS